MIKKIWTVDITKTFARCLTCLAAECRLYRDELKNKFQQGLQLFVCLMYLSDLVADLRPCPQKGVPGQRRQVAKRSVCGE